MRNRAHATRALERRSGLSLIEILVAMTITVVAAGMLVRTLLATGGYRTVSREKTLAGEAARCALERMRAVPFGEAWARFNDDPSDDPDGEGTAPGPYFAVQGLRPLEDAPQGMQGAIRFPHHAQPHVLREDSDDAALGFPRDLNGDNVIDELDHAHDYLVLPVEIVVRWKGRLGPREQRTFTMLAEFAKGQP